MVAKGIIDPTMAVRAALQDASSVAGLITTEAMIADAPEKKMMQLQLCQIWAVWAAWAAWAVRWHGRYGM